MKERVLLQFFLIFFMVEPVFAYEVQTRLNHLFHQVVSDESVPGVSVAVAKSNGFIWARGYGFSDLENRVPMTPDTKLRIGSIAKVFTAAALMRLYEQGHIDFESRVRDILPEWPAKHAPITLSDLVSHTSGIRSYNSEAEFYSNIDYETTLDALSIFKDDDLLFTPGTEVQYTTYGWTLVSAIMERVSEEKHYRQILQEQVLDPLSLTDTLLDESSPVISHRQRAYSFIDQRLINSPEVNFSNKFAGGGLLSTPIDVAKFAMAHLDSGYLSAAALALLFEEKILPNNTRTGIGIGWFIGFESYLTALRDELEQATLPRRAVIRRLINIIQTHPHSVMHSGWSVGGESMLILCIEHQHAAVVMKNVERSTGPDITSLALRALDAF